MKGFHKTQMHLPRLNNEFVTKKIAYLSKFEGEIVVKIDPKLYISLNEDGTFRIFESALAMRNSNSERRNILKETIRKGLGGAEPLYPDVKVKLYGRNSEFFSILGRVMSTLYNNGVPREIMEEFRTEATSGDYVNLLKTCMKYVRCD